MQSNSSQTECEMILLLLAQPSTSKLCRMPLELWTGSHATLGHMCVFWTECYVHVPKQKRHEWDQTSKLG